jgi:hypothetical protein
MARAPKAKNVKQPMVREAAIEYQARPIAEVFWLAFKELSEEDQGAFLRKLLDDEFWYEEIEDAVSIIQARGEPTQPYSEIRKEMVDAGLL